ncbi:MAG: type II toxin-antitoxin system Phd/YefM family antitoxin [Ilumatobacteraceae bacterium]
MAPPDKSRHISVRVSDELFAGLEALAAANAETVSQVARRLLTDGLAPRAGDIDDAIAILQRLRRSPAGRPTVPVGTVDQQTESPPPASESDAPVRTVNVLNAKANLSRLLADVARGDEIVIVHAGSSRARLVAADD